MGAFVCLLDLSLRRGHTISLDFPCYFSTACKAEESLNMQKQKEIAAVLIFRYKFGLLLLISVRLWILHLCSWKQIKADCICFCIELCIYAVENKSMQIVFVFAWALLLCLNNTNQVDKLIDHCMIYELGNMELDRAWGTNPIGQARGIKHTPYLFTRIVLSMLTELWKAHTLICLFFFHI